MTKKQPKKIEPRIVGIFISPEAGQPMQRVKKVRAIRAQGLDNDRYKKGRGSFNNKSGVGNRQVTIMNALFFRRTKFKFEDARRNIFVIGIEVNRLIGKVFVINGVRFRGVKYCFPCNRPSELSGKKGFAKIFHDNGGIIAKVLKGGEIKEGDVIVPIWN